MSVNLIKLYLTTSVSERHILCCCSQGAAIARRWSRPTCLLLDVWRRRRRMPSWPLWMPPSTKTWAANTASKDTPPSNILSESYQHVLSLLTGKWLKGVAVWKFVFDVCAGISYLSTHTVYWYKIQGFNYFGGIWPCWKMDTGKHNFHEILMF